MRYMKHLLAFVTFMVSVAGVFAQSKLGPRNLGQKINSRYDEVRPVYSPDGKRLYFSRINHPENKYGKQDAQEIWVYEIVNEGVWTPPKRFDVLNTGTNNAVLGVGEKGHLLLLNGVYNSSATTTIRKGLSLSQWNPATETWSTPKEVEVKGIKCKAENVTAWMSPKGNRIIIATGASPEDNSSDLVMIQKSGDEWSRPLELKGLNSSKSDFSPCLTADGHSVYFVSNREAGIYKIFKATRKDTANWNDWSVAAPVEANKYINRWQPFFTVHPSGKWALICSAEKSYGRSDIFKISLLPERVQSISGRLPEEDGVPLPPSRIKLFADGVPIDSVKFNPNGTYTAFLPEGKDYTITVEQQIHKWGGRDIMEDKHRVTLKGKIVDKDEQPYPENSYRLLINDISTNDVAVEPDGSFTLHLPPLKNKTDKYTISATFSDGHTEKIPVVSDATANMVTVDKDTEVTVRGILLDGDTGMPMTQGVTIKLPDNPNVPAAFDGAGGYEIKLPGGRKHLVSFYVPDYLAGSVPVDTRHAPEGGAITVEKILLQPLRIGQVVELTNVYFLHGVPALRKESYTQLDEVVRYFDAIPNLKAEIVSHTDNVRDEATSKNLSRKRAQAVMDYMVSKGVLKTHLVAVGMGSSKPIASNDTYAGRQHNNRVELVVLEK